MIGNVNNITSSAFKAYTTGLSVTANNIANMDSEGFKPSEVKFQEGKTGGVTASIRKDENAYEVDLSEEAVDLITTSSNFKANLKVLQTYDEVTESLLDIVA
ncbi:MAG: hypothetical protein HZB79_08115 [Deltaproteobacteria bacterium]|nr:hypothetical protein [Deltaproteobacteria bacterium]